MRRHAREIGFIFSRIQKLLPATLEPNREAVFYYTNLMWRTVYPVIQPLIPDEGWMDEDAVNNFMTVINDEEARIQASIERFGYNIADPATLDMVTKHARMEKVRLQLDLWNSCLTLSTLR